MVDSISNNMAAPQSTLATPTQVLPEPAVQVTSAAAGRHGGNATPQHGGKGYPQSTFDNPEQAFDEINAMMKAWDTGLRFEIDEDTHKVVVSIIDTTTGDVLRQIPSEEVLHVAKMITKFQGQILDVKA
jgi:flagellar protein FlaG